MPTRRKSFDGDHSLIFRNGEAFRVYVVMPLLPAFEGELGTATGAAIQAVSHWNYSSICRGGNSLLEKVATIGEYFCESMAAICFATKISFPTAAEKTNQ